MKKYLALAAAAAVFVASPASAITVPGATDYTFSGTFAGYPSSLTGTFTYDQAAGGVLDAFSLDLGGTHFDLTNASIFHDPNSNIIYIGGDSWGVANLAANDSADDFYLAVHVLPGTGYLLGSGLTNPFRFTLYNPNISCGTRGNPCQDYTPGVASQTFTLTHVPHIDDVSGAVPEPATWAMMLLGFGGIAFAMRHKRTPVLATA